jgi:RND family efflux transporter MFP subunit
VKKYIKGLVIFGVVAVFSATAIYVIQRKKAELSKAPIYCKKPVPVNVSKAKSGHLQVNQEYIATVESSKTSQITSRVSSIIDVVHYDEGDTVKTGDLLISLDDREIKKEISAMGSTISQAKAELTANESKADSLKESVQYWQSELRRDALLLSRNATSKARYAATKEKLNTFKGQLLSAEHQSLSIKQKIQSLGHSLQRLKIQLSYCHITSPFNGLITSREVDPGVLATPGKHLMVIEDVSCRKLVFDVPQQDLDKLKVGNKIVYHVGGKLRESSLSHIFPALDKARLCRSEARIWQHAGGELKIGSQLPITVIIARSPSLLTLIPVEGLIDDGKNTYVYVVESGRLRKKHVIIWGVDYETAGVKGIAPGETVVVNTYLNWVKLSDGLKVETVQ